jgi:hypothetical protein
MVFAVSNSISIPIRKKAWKSDRREEAISWKETAPVLLTPDQDNTGQTIEWVRHCDLSLQVSALGTEGVSIGDPNSGRLPEPVEQSVASISDGGTFSLSILTDKIVLVV